MFGFTGNEIMLFLIFIGTLVTYISMLKEKKGKKTKIVIYKNHLISIYLLIISLIGLFILGVGMTLMNFNIAEKDFYFTYAFIISSFFILFIPSIHGYVNRNKVQDITFNRWNIFGLLFSIICVLVIILINKGYFNIIT